jgi:hypothetical protein
MKRAFFVGSWLVVLPVSAAAECPATLPSSSPVSVPSDERTNSYAWYGTEALAVRLSSDGIWRGMGPEHRYRDKLWFWRRGYSPREEPQPRLTIEGVQLGDATKTDRLRIESATNAFGPGWARMLVGMEFPSPGCWQVDVTYEYLAIRQNLTFVVDVASFERAR